MKHLFSWIICLLLNISILLAVEPANYYNNAEGKSANTLRLALQQIIDNHTVVSYDGLFNIYKKSDVTASGNVWDMYSTCTWTPGNKQCGNYHDVCDCYNREHSVPQSWFNKRSPMVSDAFHIYPTDGYVNNQRSNYPFGECSNGITLSSKAKGRLGSSSFSGYSGTVFEPDDEYKGDFARSYFYMATRYAEGNLNSTANGQVVFTSDANLTNYSIQLFMKWHREDPVSQKEKDRNDAVYGFQHNRNPFIDHPELAEYIWGNLKGQNWYINSTDVSTTEKVNITLYPNPTVNELHIIGLEDNFTYSILNLAGQIMDQGTSEQNNIIFVGHLSEGIYLLDIHHKETHYMQKIIITRH